MTNPASPELRLEETPLRGTRRSLAVALALASGAIVLIWSEIWLVVGLTLWAVVGLIGESITGEIVAAILILPPAIWASWKTLTLAVEAERYPDES